MPEYSDRELLLQIATKLDGLREDLEKTTLELSNMRQRVYGNGKPGIITDIAEIRRDVNGIVAGISARDKIALTLGGVVVSLIVTFLWGIFTGQVTVTFP